MCILMYILMCFLNKKVHLLASELYIYQSARCINKKNCVFMLDPESLKVCFYLYDAGHAH